MLNELPTGQEVYQAVLNDPRFAEHQDEIAILRPAIEMLPQLVAPRQNDKVRLSNLFLTCAELLHEAFSKGLIDLKANEEDEEQVKEWLKAAFDEFCELALHLDDVLEEMSRKSGVTITDATALLNPDSPLNAEMRKKVEADELTCGELLRVQPSVYVPEFKLTLTYVD